MAHLARLDFPDVQLAEFGNEPIEVFNSTKLLVTCINNELKWEMKTQKNGMTELLVKLSGFGMLEPNSQLPNTRKQR